MKRKNKNKSWASRLCSVVCAVAIVMTSILSSSGLPAAMAMTSFTTSDDMPMVNMVQASSGTDIIDFNSSTAITNMGVVSSEVYTRNGSSYSAYWGDHLTKGSLYIDSFNGASTDWSGYDSLDFWLYSENATGAPLKFVIHSPANAQGASGYFYKDITIDWTGWKKVSLHLSSLREVRSPSLQTIHRVQIVANRDWGLQASADSQLYMASATLVKKEEHNSRDIVDFDDAGLLQDMGVTPSEAYTKHGNSNSAYWGNHLTKGSLYIDSFNGVSMDWSGYDSLDFWIYSEHATEAPLKFVIHSPADAQGVSGYYFKDIKLNWTGWNKVSLKLTSLASVRSPSLQNVEKVQIVANRDWGLQASADSQLYMASATLIQKQQDSLDILNFSNAEMLQDMGVVPTEAYTKNDNKYSAYWGNHLTKGSLFMNIAGGAPTDWSDYDTLDFWMYSEHATGAPLKFVIHSPANSQGASYFYQDMVLDWTGWKKVSLSLGSLEGLRSPSLGNIRMVQIVANGDWGLQASVDSGLYVASATLVRHVEPSDIDIVDFNDAELLQDMGVVASEEHTKNDNSYSAYWGNHLTKGSLFMNIAGGAPADWSDYETLDFWMYSENATGAPLKFVIHSPANSQGASYFYQDMVLDWTGWKQVSLNLGSLEGLRSPSLGNIRMVQIVANGDWGLQASADSHLYIASATLTNKQVNSGTGIIDFNDAAQLTNIGFTPTEVHTKNDNRYSAYWGNHLTKGSLFIHSFNGVSRDWSNYNALDFWIYSENATGAPLKFVIHSPANSEGSSYLSKDIVLDWTGWKRVSLNLTALPGVRAPNLRTIRMIQIVAHGDWGLQGSPDSGLYIASANLRERGPLGNSLDVLYEDGTISQATAAMADAVAIYGGSDKVVVADGEVTHMRPGGVLPTLIEEGTVLAPVDLFTAFLGVSVAVDGTEYTMQYGNRTVTGQMGQRAYTSDAIQGEFSVAPRMVGDTLYVPAEAMARALGKHTVTNGLLVVVGDDDAIDVFAKRSGIGVNELAEIIAYLAAHVETDLTDIDEATFAVLKQRWVDNLVGNEDINDRSNPYIARRVNETSVAGQSAWDRLIKSEDSSELFIGITTTASSHMTAAYQNIYNMARAWGTYGTDLYHNEALKADILYALEWMYQNRYGQNEIEGTGWRSPAAFNWWDWEIASPSNLIQTMLIVEDHLTETQKINYTAMFDHLVNRPNDVGANRINKGLYMIGSALLKNDAKKIVETQVDMESIFLFSDDGRNEGASLGFGRDVYTKKKGQGFHTDGSYILHQLHAMNGVYGLEQLAKTMEYLELVQGTPFAVTTPQVNNVMDWIYKAYDPLMYQSAIFRMVLGRATSPNTYSYGTGAVLNMLKALDFAEPEDKAKISAIIKENVQGNPTIDYYRQLGLAHIHKLTELLEDRTIQSRDGLFTNHVYRNMDKVVHRRGDWAFGISMSSSRMFNYESINNENRTGWYLGDGRTELHTKGDYKYGSAVYWTGINHYRLPGTTVDTQERKAISIAPGNEYLSSKDFVGGVSLEGTYGTSAMWLESYHNDTDFGYDGGAMGGRAPAHTSDLTAKKSYFMFDNEIVLLGADIQASNNNNAEVLTVVDNVMAKTQTVTDESNEPYTITHVQASETPEADNGAENTIDQDYGTKWAAEINANITWDLGEIRPLGFITLSFASGNTRKQLFKLETSADGQTWTEVFNGSSSGTTQIDEPFDLLGNLSRYVRFTNFGNSTGSPWVSLTDAKIYNYNSDGSIGVDEGGSIGEDLFTVDGNIVALTTEDQSLNGISWAHLENGNGYYFPQDGSQTGGELQARWTSSANSFMELWFSHGVNPTGASYAYTLLPGATAEQTQLYAINPDTTVLANTADLQAVRDNKLGVTGLVFWEAGSFEGITVDQPMIVMVREDGENYNIAISDPTQKLTTGTIEIDEVMNVVEQDSVIQVQAVSGKTTINIDFTDATGRSIEAVLKKNRLTLDSTSKTVFVGDSFTVTASVYNPSLMDNGVWFIADNDVVTAGSVTFNEATRSTTAQFHAIKAGQAIVTVTTSDGRIAQCVVIVEHSGNPGTPTALGAPAQAVLSDDNGHDTGLLDGDYTIRMNLWYGENATIYQLYEDGVLIDTQSLQATSPEAQTAATVIRGKANGTYRYEAELANAAGTTRSVSHMVTVRDTAPGKPVLSHDNWDGDGSFTLRADLWWGTNATAYRLYENGELLHSAALVAATPQAQIALHAVSGRAIGEYVYTIEFINEAGSTFSERLTVRVTR